MAENSRALVWHKSSACGNSTCVEVAIDVGGVFVRDSKDPDGSHLSFNRADWRSFIADLRDNAAPPC
jgi:hypothetical protein